MNPSIRHRWEDWPGAPETGFSPCAACGKAKRNIIHRLGGRCSMCFRYFRHYELDSSRRCDECRP
jgi:hypothetical protein